MDRKESRRKSRRAMVAGMIAFLAFAVSASHAQKATDSDEDFDAYKLRLSAFMFIRLLRATFKAVMTLT